MLIKLLNVSALFLLLIIKQLLSFCFVQYQKYYIHSNAYCIGLDLRSHAISRSHKTLMYNIMLNFVPNNIIKVVPGDSPWITRSLKNMLNKQNRLFKDKNSDKNRVDNFRKECEMAINNSKEDYLKKLVIN